MMQKQDEPEVIEYVPKRQRGGVVNWMVVGGLIGVWLLVLVAAVILKIRMLAMILPVLMVLLLVYVAVCTFVFIARKKQ